MGTACYSSIYPINLLATKMSQPNRQCVAAGRGEMRPGRCENCRLIPIVTFGGELSDGVGPDQKRHLELCTTYLLSRQVAGQILRVIASHFSLIEPVKRRCQSVRDLVRKFRRSSFEHGNNPGTIRVSFYIPMRISVPASPRKSLQFQIKVLCHVKTRQDHVRAPAWPTPHILCCDTRNRDLRFLLHFRQRARVSKTVIALTSSAAGDVANSIMAATNLTQKPTRYCFGVRGLRDRVFSDQKVKRG